MNLIKLKVGDISYYLTQYALNHHISSMAKLVENNQTIEPTRFKLVLMMNSDIVIDTYKNKLLKCRYTFEEMLEKITIAGN